MFWRGVLGYLPVNIVQGVIGLLTIVAFTRLLSPGDYGVFALAASTMVLSHTALFTWIEAAMARFQVQARERGETPDHLATLFRAWALFGLLFPLLAVCAVNLAPLGGEMKLAVSAGLAAIPFRSLVILVLQRRRADGEVGSAAALDIVQSIGGFGIGVALAGLGLGGAAPMIGMAAISALSAAVVLPRELAGLKGGHWQTPRIKGYAAYGLPIALSLILSLVIASTDRFVLAAFEGEATVGAYHAGYSLANRTLDVMFVWLGMAGGPAMVAALERGGQAALIRAAREQISFMVLLTLPAAIGLALVSAPLAQLLIGPALAADAGRVTPWIALGGFFSGITTYYFHEAFTLGRCTGLLMAAMVLPAGLNLGLNLILVPRFGIDGAMWATTASYLAGAVASWALGRRVTALPLPLDTIGRALLACVPMVLIVLSLPDLGGLPELALKASLGAAAYGVTAWLLNAGGLRVQGLNLLRSFRARPAA